MAGEKSFLCRMLHWGPLLASSIICLITTSTVYCHLQWWPVSHLFGCIDLLLFMLCSSQCLANLFRAAYVGPGFVPLKWYPKNPQDEAKLQFCSVCEGYKAPRSHHCRKCDRCVLKMDHHCPWINNCCGFRNQLFFIQFLFWGVVGCLHACLILGPSIYRALFRVYYLYYGTGEEPVVELGVFGLFYAIFAIGLALGVVLAVGFLLAIQIRAAARNKSGIEEYIVNKAHHRPRENEDDIFIYPYDLGWKRNIADVFWHSETSDGFTFPVVDGCDQFTFTIEQLLQKEAKRQLVVEYRVVKPYDGSIFCVCLQFGCRAHFCQPITEDARLKVKEGQSILVSRWRRKWLYGELFRLSKEDEEKMQQLKKRPRGWFPRVCVVECEEDNSASSSQCDKPKND